MKRRTKIATILTAGLLSASLVGVGFAAWTIGASEMTKDTAGGNVTVEAVNDGTVTLKVEGGEGDISFTAKSAGKFGDGQWLDCSDASPESLSIDITITITGHIGSLEITCDTSDWQDAIDANLVTAPTYSVKKSTKGGGSATEFDDASFAGNKLTLDYTGDGAKTLVVTAKFGWGTIFNSVNPTDFYNSLKAEDLAASSSADTNMRADQHAVKYLNMLKTNMTGKSYTFVVKATPATV